jgi:uncharacterized protein
MATLTVVGRAQVSVPPDEASVAITVEAVRPGANDALADVAERARRVVALLDDLDVGPASRTTTGVMVSEAGEHVDGTWQHRGYRASERLTVRLDDAAKVGQLLGEAVERAEAQVDGPWWRVSLTNPGRAEALGAAADDARTRAEALAEGLGMRLGALVEAVESGAITPEPRLAPGVRALAAADVPVEAGEATVDASVSVKFQLERESWPRPES